MKHASIALLAGIALMACSTSPAEDPSNPSADACGALQHQALIGKPITEPGVPAEGPVVRYIRPNTQVTMDFRADRLNIDIDASEKITGFRCR